MTHEKEFDNDGEYGAEERELDPVFDKIREDPSLQDLLKLIFSARCDIEEVFERDPELLEILCFEDDVSLRETMLRVVKNWFHFLAKKQVENVQALTINGYFRGANALRLQNGLPRAVQIPAACAAAIAASIAIDRDVPTPDFQTIISRSLLMSSLTKGECRFLLLDTAVRELDLQSTHDPLGASKRDLIVRGALRDLS